MPALDESSLLRQLLAATSVGEYQSILAAVGDSDEAKLGVPFSPFGLVWRAFADEESNISTINLATRPGRSLAERITNAIDALFQERFVANVKPPPSARESARTWFGRPDAIVRSWYQQSSVDRRIHLAVLEPIRKVVESEESDVIHCRAPELKQGGARCGRLNIAVRRASAVCVIPAI